MTEQNKKFWNSLQKLVDKSDIHIDRPKGSAHPRYPEYIYPYDYGELVGTKSQDGAGIDCWVGSMSDKIVTGIIVIIDPLKKDSEIKVLIDCTDKEMQEILPYQNRGSMSGVLHKRKECDFNEWMHIKYSANIRNMPDDMYVHVGEVWWVNWGKNIGFEQDGKGSDYSRPILVLRVLSRSTFLVVPLTTSKQKHNFRIPISDFGGKKSKVVISQIRVIDIKRFQELVGSTSAKSVKEIKKATMNMIR